MLAGDMADENDMFVFETDGAFALRVFDLREDVEDGIAREEAAEREAKPATVRGDRAPSISLICMQKRDDWDEMDRRWQAASSKLDKLDKSN